jgi:hypothetical protein
MLAPDGWYLLHMNRQSLDFLSVYKGRLELYLYSVGLAKLQEAHLD